MGLNPFDIRAVDQTICLWCNGNIAGLNPFDIRAVDQTYGDGYGDGYGDVLIPLISGQSIRQYQEQKHVRALRLNPFDIRAVDQTARHDA